MKQRFEIGDRVKVRCAIDVIKEKDILNDKGIIVAVRLMHPLSPEFHQIAYKVELDGPYAKRIITTSSISYYEGYNVNENVQSIRKACNLCKDKEPK